MHVIQSRIMCLALIVLVFTAAPAWAADRDPDSFVWFISNTEYGAQNSALAMARGKAWPVVFGQYETITLRPTENWHNGTFWHEIAPGVGPGTIRAASSSDGRVAGVASSPFQPGLLIGTSGAATFLNPDIRAVTFSAGGALVTATSQTVNGFSYGGGYTINDIAMSPFGDGGVLAGPDFYSTQTGEFFDLDNTGPNFQGPGSLTFDAHGRPHAVDQEANVYSFDTLLGQWTVSSLGSIYSDTVLPIAADSTGVVGTALVDENLNLYYGYWTLSAGWNTTLVDTNVDDDYQIGLDFDYADLPVISYSKNGTLHVAYDPILVPEPATLLLMGGVGLFAWGRRSTKSVNRR